MSDWPKNPDRVEAALENTERECARLRAEVARLEAENAQLRTLYEAETRKREIFARHLRRGVDPRSYADWRRANDDVYDALKAIAALEGKERGR